MIWRRLYNILALPLLRVGLLLSALVIEKVRRAVKGRLGEGDQLRAARARCEPGTARVLMHCASAGELESAIPLIDELHRAAKVSVILSYYSPSAVERAQTVQGIADHIYLPFDSPRRVRRLLDIIEPDLVMFVKHDVWPNLSWIAADRDIPVALINAYARPDAAMLHRRILIPFAREMHRALAEIHAVSAEDAARLSFLARPLTPVYRTGDTRFDRVRQRALTSRGDQGLLADRTAGRRVFVAGSSWPVDEEMLLHAWRHSAVAGANGLLILVPHEPHEDHLTQVEAQFAEFGVLRLSRLEEMPESELPGVLLVDKMGILAGLYGLADGVYVGGGFGAGVHSVIEPAVFGTPVAFGPNNGMSHEARELLRQQAAVLIEDTGSMTQYVQAVLTNDESIAHIGRRGGGYVAGKVGVARTLAVHLSRRYLDAAVATKQRAPLDEPA